MTKVHTKKWWKPHNPKGYQNVYFNENFHQYKCKISCFQNFPLKSIQTRGFSIMCWLLTKYDESIPYDPPIWPQFRPIGCISKRPPIAPILFPVVSLKHYHVGFWLPAIFFHIYNALGQCTAFGRFNMVEKVLTLGSFPFYSIKDPKVRRVSF